MKPIMELLGLYSKPTHVPENRPPSILSPHGEGYCSHCRFVIGLDKFGLMDGHSRGANGAGEGKPCPGSARRPAGRTPYASRLSMFRVTSPDTWCPECRQSVKTTRRTGVQVYARHNFPPAAEGSFPLACPNGFGRTVA